MVEKWTMRFKCYYCKVRKRLLRAYNNNNNNNNNNKLY